MTNPPELDRWISAEFERLAEIIEDYDPHLELRWIPPELRTTQIDKAKPYCIFDTRNNKIVMYASELDTPVGILEKLFDIDNKNGDVLKKMRSHNAAIEAMRLKEQMDALEEARELTAFAIGNTKSKWKHNGVVYDDEMRRLDGHQRYYQ
jgi:hypothetical protein